MQELGLLSARATRDMSFTPEKSNIVVPSEVLPDDRDLNPVIKNNIDAFEEMMNSPESFDSKASYAFIPLSQDRKLEIDKLQIADLDKNGLSVAEALYATRNVSSMKVPEPSLIENYEVGTEIRNTALNQIKDVESLEELTETLGEEYNNGVKVRDLGFESAQKLSRTIEIALVANDPNNQVNEHSIGNSSSEYQSPYSSHKYDEVREKAQDAISQITKDLPSNEDGSLNYQALNIDNSRKVSIDKHDVRSMNLDNLTPEEVLYKTGNQSLATDLIIRDFVGDNEADITFDPKSNISNYDQTHNDQRAYELDGIANVNPIYRNNNSYFEMIANDADKLEREVGYESVPISQERQLMLDNTPFSKLDLNNLTVGETLYATRDYFPIPPENGNRAEWELVGAARSVALDQISDVGSLEDLTDRTTDAFSTTSLKLILQDTPGITFETSKEPERVREAGLER